MKRETEQLLSLADHDFALAEVSLQRGFDEQCVFHCQQTIEKALKALQIERSDAGRPRRTHDLVSLAEELLLELPDHQWNLLRRLGEQYATSRYGEGVDYSQARVLEYLQQTKALFAWLQLQMN